MGQFEALFHTSYLPVSYFEEIFVLINKKENQCQGDKIQLNGFKIQILQVEKFLVRGLYFLELGSLTRERAFGAFRI